MSLLKRSVNQTRLTFLLTLHSTMSLLKPDGSFYAHNAVTTLHSTMSLLKLVRR